MVMKHSFSMWYNLVDFPFPLSVLFIHSCVPTVEVDLFRKLHIYSDIRLGTNFTSYKNTWVKWKAKELFSQYLHLLRDQQSRRYSHLYVHHLKIPSASEIQKYYGEMTNQKISAQWRSMQLASCLEWKGLQISTGCSKYSLTKAPGIE